MIAVFHLAREPVWVSALGDTPWALLPVANRPLLDYWLETCSEQGIGNIQLVLGEGAKRIEDYAGDGRRWNVRIHYSFARPGESAVQYLRSVSAHWQEGLFFISGPLFLRRRQAYAAGSLKNIDACLHAFDGEPWFVFGKNGDEVSALLDGNSGARFGLEQAHIQPFQIGGTAAYFDLNMKMVAGEFARYTTAGFSGADGSSIGFNVRTPPSSHLEAPILVGDDCRFGAMTTIGPNAVIANHVIVDAHSELKNCLILRDTYIGRNLEIRNKIVAGNRLISPDDGTTVEIDDSWVVAQNRPEMRTEDVIRYIILWFIGLGLALVQTVPFLILFPLVRLRRIGIFNGELFHDPRTGYIRLPVFHKLKNRICPLYSIFLSLSLDRYPWLLRALIGRLFVCGQPPMRHPEDDAIIKEIPRYYPGVFCYQDYNKESDKLVDSLWYAHIRSLYEDIKILIKALVTRFLRAGH